MAISFSYPDLSSHPDFNDHEVILKAEDPSIDFKAFIAVHNTQNGPARGGCRYWSQYKDETAAQKDVLRLSRGMTYKTTLAGLPYGGGKTVIMGKEGTTKPTPEIMRALGAMLNELNGLYETGEDVGTCTADIQIAGEITEHVRTRAIERAGSVDLPGGPPLYTAHGIYYGIKSAVQFKFNQDSLQDVRIAVKGLGNVAMSLCKFLHAEGARLIVTDIDPKKVRYAQDKYGATAINPEEIIFQDVDVYTPCALGGDLNDKTIPKIKASIIAGAANNQLARAENAQMLFERDILYAPDYAINAGGVINVVLVGASHEAIMDKVAGIGSTLNEIFTRSKTLNHNTADIADLIVKERLRQSGMTKISA